MVYKECLVDSLQLATAVLSQMHYIFKVIDAEPNRMQSEHKSC